MHATRKAVDYLETYLGIYINAGSNDSEHHQMLLSTYMLAKEWSRSLFRTIPWLAISVKTEPCPARVFTDLVSCTEMYVKSLLLLYKLAKIVRVWGRREKRLEWMASQISGSLPSPMGDAEHFPSCKLRTHICEIKPRDELAFKMK